MTLLQNVGNRVEKKFVLKTTNVLKATLVFCALSAWKDITVTLMVSANFALVMLLLT